MYFKGVNRGLKVTTLGWQIIMLTMAVGIIAISTAINATFIFLGISLGAFVISGVISEKIMNNIKVFITNKEHIQNEENPIRIIFCIKNTSKDINLYSLTNKFYFEDPHRKSAYEANKIISEKKTNFISSSEQKEIETFTKIINRGLYREIYISQHTSFPFGIFSKYKITKVDTQLYVTPKKRQELNDLWNQIIEKTKNKITGSDEIVGHESLTFSTPVNRIDWKKNAILQPNLWVAKKYNSNKNEKKSLYRIF